ncbi:hypothetical protein N8574_01835 [Akkermansiaceae bacterium]|nr:hypothetical protein [Akkermansiaceae bacterium]
MLRKYNYTDRQRIPRNEITFEYFEGEGETPSSFRAELSSNALNHIQSDAQIWVEAYSGATVERYDFGRAGKIISPKDTSLKAFPRGLKPLFRIKVTDPLDSRCRLLAFADKIAPADSEEVEGSRQSILNVEYVDLGQQIWNLRIDDSIRPILQLNSSISEPVGIRVLANSSEFIGLVYPAVIRQILSYLLLEDLDPITTFDHDWIKYGNTISETVCPNPEKYGDEDEENFLRDVREWIDDVINNFCHNRLTRDAYTLEKSEQYKND